MSDPKDRRASELSVEELLALAAQREAESNPLRNMTEMELAGEAIGERFKEEVLRSRILRMPVEDNTPKSCPLCGRLVPVKAQRKKRSLRALSGAIRFERNYHYCKHCRSGFYPRDIELGLPAKGRITSEFERRIADFGLNDPFEQSAERFTLHYGVPISSNLVRRVVDRLGERREGTDETALQRAVLPPERTRAKLVVVESDGSMLPMRGEWREAKLGMVTRGDKRHVGRRGVRGVIAQTRYAAVLGDQEEFARALEAALKTEGAQRAEVCLWLGDGAPGNWRLAEKLRPGAVQILDVHHAVEHLMDAGRALLGEHDGLLVQWQRTCKRLLLEHSPQTVINELMDCLEEAPLAAVEHVNAQVRYVQTNAKRMDYRAYLQSGWPIATGAVESAHKHTLQIRMKRAGQRWSTPRARRMVCLRAAYRTAGASRFHAAINLAYATRAARSPRRKRVASNR
jgi:hypothetical protein